MAINKLGERERVSIAWGALVICKLISCSKSLQLIESAFGGICVGYYISCLLFMADFMPSVIDGLAHDCMVKFLLPLINM